MTTKAASVSPTDEKRPAKTGLMTGEELSASGDIGRAELIQGNLVRMSPTGYLHGYVEVNFAAELRSFVREHGLGQVLGGEVGIYTSRNPDTVRGADVVFISNQRLAQVKTRSYLDVAPELIVEVLAPDDRWSAVMDKLEEYFAIGVKAVWVADPGKMQMHVYRSLTAVQRLGVDDVLQEGEILPGFSVPVRNFF